VKHRRTDELIGDAKQRRVALRPLQQWSVRICRPARRLSRRTRRPLSAAQLKAVFADRFSPDCFARPLGDRPVNHPGGGR